MEDDNQLPPWLGNPALNTGDDEESSLTIGIWISGRVLPSGLWQRNDIGVQ
jgi:hypothetical protein